MPKHYVINSGNKRDQELRARIVDLANRAKIESWTDYIEELHVPADLGPALMTGRTELLALAKPRAMSEDEVKTLYDLIRGLIETNKALQEHASELASLVQTWMGNIKGAVNTAQRIEQFANFRHSHILVDEETESEE